MGCLQITVNCGQCDNKVYCQLILFFRNIPLNLQLKLKKLKIFVIRNKFKNANCNFLVLILLTY